MALFIATAGGLGYLKPAPGTWGSIGGIALTLAFFAPFYDPLATILTPVWRRFPFIIPRDFGVVFSLEILTLLMISLAGVWAADHSAKHLNKSDPQQVVIDEVSGMMITLAVGLGAHLDMVRGVKGTDFVGFGWLFSEKLLNWKYLLAGFILFRVFDIWKPFPARHAEGLPGGWGIMADDWIAAIYAAMGLWIARAFGL